MPKEKKTTSYKYLSLREAYHTGDKLVNAYGVVTEWGTPRATRGSDWMLYLKVIDPTVRDITGDNGVAYTDLDIQCFAANKDDLPRPRAKGDIIRIHRMTKVMWKGRPQFNAKFGMIAAGAGAGGFSRCHFLLFEGAGANPQPPPPSAAGDAETSALAPRPSDAPYQRSSNAYTLEPGKDDALLAEMRAHWTAIGGVASVLDAGWTIPIQRINLDSAFDLHAYVLDVARANGRTTLIVWDGSDARPLPPALCTGLGESQGAEPESQNDETRYDALYYAPIAPEEPEVGKKLAEAERKLAGGLVSDGGGSIPRLGSAFPVVVRDFDVARMDLPRPGTWIRLRNLASWVRYGQVQGVFTQSSRWASAEPNEAWMEAYAKRRDARIVANWAPPHLVEDGQSQSQGGPPREPATAVLARTAHGNQPLHTLREVLLSPPPSRHRCVVRVVEHFPADAHDFCALKESKASSAKKPPSNAAAPPKKRARGGKLRAKEEPADDASPWASVKPPENEEEEEEVVEEWEFNLALTLEDATGRLRVNLCGEEARTFFHGIPPGDLWASDVTYQRVKDRVETLATYPTTDRNWQRGWMEACVMSYVIPSAGPNEPEQRCYQLFGTSCVA